MNIPSYSPEDLNRVKKISDKNKLNGLNLPPEIKKALEESVEKGAQLHIDHRGVAGAIKGEVSSMDISRRMFEAYLAVHNQQGELGCEYMWVASFSSLLGALGFPGFIIDEILNHFSRLAQQNNPPQNHSHKCGRPTEPLG